MASDPPRDHATVTQSLAERLTLAQARPALEPALSGGQRFGPYLIHRLRGRGGMGEVYEAEQAETGRRVALKLLLDPQPTPEARERFLREGRLAASISHPNSVYVYGTEEIEGTWAISMELAGAGTLKDRVKAKGPLLAQEAVDAILQVIDGLEAAAAAGILHRDVKPSNCFVEADGTVKIGDFGLSLRTLSRERSHLTSTGAFLGTPAFASPEQLRGDDLDARSDLYSAGATLYYLLTGHAPFEDSNLMRLLTTIAERPPQSPQLLRPQKVTRGLAEVVLRSLEKQPGRRFADYAALRAALLPFGSWRPPVGDFLLRRTAAAVVDVAICWLPLLALWLIQPGSRHQSPDFVLRAWPMLTAVTFFYWALPSWLLGGSFGEILLGLRLVDAEGSRPAVWRSSLRAAEMASILMLYSTQPGTLFAILPALMMGRFQSSGWRGPLEALSGTFLRSSLVPRRLAADRETSRIDPQPGTTERPIGPYAVVRSFAASEPKRLVLGRDATLNRNVWIEILPPGTPPLAAARRDWNRVTRLRWLNGKRGEENWDAYEAPSGRGLLDAVQRPQPWPAVRQWLLDVLQEVLSRRREGTLPPQLTLAHVWVTASARALMLDGAAPSQASAAHLEPSFAPEDDNALQGFLHRIAVSALTGGAASPDAGALPPLPLPRDARCFLTELHERSFERPEMIRRMLRVLIQQPLELSRQERAFNTALYSVIFSALAWSMPPIPKRGLVILLGIGLFMTFMMLVARTGAKTPAQILEQRWGRRPVVPLGRPTLWPVSEEILTPDGRAASAKAVALRRVLGLLPILLVCLGFLSPLRPWVPALAAAAAAVYVAAFVWSVAMPGRGVLQHLTGTRLVPAFAKSLRTGNALPLEVRLFAYESQRAAMASPQLEHWTGDSAEDWEDLEKVLGRQWVASPAAPRSTPSLRGPTQYS